MSANNLQEIKAYMKEVKSLSDNYEMSVFWEKQLECIKGTDLYENLEHLNEKEFELFVHRLGYGFTDRENSVSDIRVDKDFSYAMSLMQKLRTLAKKISVKKLNETKDNIEHARALYYLQRNDLLEGYLDFINKFAIKSNMSIARHYYYAIIVNRLVKQNFSSQPLSICEIGAGAGNLAFFLANMGLVKNYCIVDLPEMLINSSSTICKYLKDSEIKFNTKFEPDSQTTKPIFWFYSPQYLDCLPNNEFDLCLNFNSFMEMDEATRDGYIKTIYRIGKKDALFINVNRRQNALPNRDGSSFDNNPLLYPYEKNDKVLIWEEEEFQQATRATFGSMPKSYAIIRACLINPS